ncbi:N-acetylglucosaminyldiphosphoundecaprenol N-acetyl-beta-D-mannosaminyltransferase [Amycolatopsis xylanica]|uniref:N-acetylglucosaminyldiphosphoundecaprenol N-acetyl-beta-D-mannosaminyltransferase n=1 Tax=Amycolatopsis xylanica TaxID=589385 RepID=A0A1H3L8B1_9PSEU|nr:N-acetylglucosaminyldiphosphoundecaprenol N-acetyl-beta-D-mannosaminyltransferase [Amycolatopsis xylanica]
MSTEPATRLDPLRPRRTVRVGAVDIFSLREAELVRMVEQSWRVRKGGWIVTANVDIVRAATRDRRLAELVAEADVVVADGMPVVWAGRIAGEPLPERVTGASLVFSLAEAAAREGRSIYLLGGQPGVPEAAAKALTERYEGLIVAGTQSPEFGFEKTPGGLAAVAELVVEAKPDLVLVGLGFPKQEHTIKALRAALPDSWYIGCGAGIPMAAGEFTRAPSAMQRMGAEWLHRLALEPKRLARRYLLEDAPFALRLLAGAVRRRISSKPGV